MCVTSTGRRRSLTLQVLPSHLLPTSSSLKAMGTELTSSSPQLTKGKRPKKRTAAAHHNLPHHPSVQHHYHDHAADPTIDPSLVKHKAKGGVIVPFPVKLHGMLDKIEADGLAHVVSWQPHGRCFVVHKPKEFVNHIMPHYFKQSKMASFQRQLNLYGFNRLTGGLDKGGYYHEMFLRGKVSLAFDIHRKRVKGTGVRLPTNPEDEPNFYALPPMTKDVVAMAMVSSMPPPLPALPDTTSSSSAGMMDMAELLRDSNNHSRKIAQAKKKRKASDLMFFEGRQFHYLDPRALPSLPAPPQLPQPQVLAPPSQPIDGMKLRFARRTSTIVSESESSDNDDDALLPNFSASTFEWDGPLSSPSLQAHMRRSSFQSFQPPQLEDDIESFFQSFDMPVDKYHTEIEHMDVHDDTTFGFLLEKAITE
eukprot:11010_1